LGYHSAIISVSAVDCMVTDVQRALSLREQNFQCFCI